MVLPSRYFTFPPSFPTEPLLFLLPHLHNLSVIALMCLQSSVIHVYVYYCTLVADHQKTEALLTTES